MNSGIISKKGKLKQLKSKGNFKKLKSDYFLLKMFDIIKKNKSLNIIKYNKKMQNRLNLSIKDYEIYTQIEIEIIPCKEKYGKFINISNEEKNIIIFILIIQLNK